MHPFENKQLVPSFRRTERYTRLFRNAIQNRGVFINVLDSERRSADSSALLASFYNSGKPIALVCHSPGVLRHVPYNRAPLVKGKQVTGFTNGEEEEMQLTHVVPFLVEDELLRLGATFEKRANWPPFFVVDGRLITGQNPASSTTTAQTLIRFLGEKGTTTIHSDIFCIRE
jgi:putative intracellular protease/amidase